MDSAINFVLTLILRLIGIVMVVVAVVDEAVRHLLAQAGINGQTQSAVVVIAAVLVIVGALRLLGGVFGFLITLLLILLILNVLMPGIHLPATAHF